MYKKSIKILSTLLLLLLVVTGCSSSANRKMTIGTINGNSYINDYYKMEINAPDSFTVFSQDQLKTMMKNIDTTNLTNSDALNKALEKGDITNLVLCLISTKEPIDGFSPNLSIVTENIGSKKDINKYLEAANKTITTAFPNAKFEKIDNKTIGGRDFVGQKISYSYNGVNLNQEQYYLIDGNYALVLGITYLDDTSKNAITPIFENIKFN